MSLITYDVEQNYIINVPIINIGHALHRTRAKLFEIM